MLFGVAWFLQASDLDVYERSEENMSPTWTVGGRIATRWQRLILPAKIWRLSGTRPLIIRSAVSRAGAILDEMAAFS